MVLRLYWKPVCQVLTSGPRAKNFLRRIFSRNSVSAQRRQQPVTHRAGSGPPHQPGRDHAPGAVIVPRHRLQLGPVGQMETDPVRTPPRVRPPDLHNLGLSRRAHLMRTAMRPRRPIGQPLIRGIPAQPDMHTLPRHLEPARHLRHRGAVQHLPHRPQPLLRHPQLHQHHRPLPQSSNHERSPPTTKATVAKCQAPTGTTVTQEPEPRPQTVKQLPEPDGQA